MNLSDPHRETTPEAEPTPSSESTESARDTSMQEYYQLKQQLLLWTVGITVVVFISVWLAYSLDVALNYAIGACTGVVYLRMLAKDVERIGSEKRRPSQNRLALFIGLVVIATQWDRLQLLPVFLGFLTYKAALLVYMLQTTLLPDSK
ncbi:ATP synthase subunit I [Oxynema sp. CENA135]|uniref:ATP synthase subunit I n=1 Tax=Oxynema sp. CENA135 TaxID=984206 RepID=UPI00351CA874